MNVTNKTNSPLEVPCEDGVKICPSWSTLENVKPTQEFIAFHGGSSEFFEIVSGDDQEPIDEIDFVVPDGFPDQYVLSDTMSFDTVEIVKSAAAFSELTAEQWNNLPAEEMETAIFGEIARMTPNPMADQIVDDVAYFDLAGSEKFADGVTVEPGSLGPEGQYSSIDLVRGAFIKSELSANQWNALVPEIRDDLIADYVSDMTTPRGQPDELSGSDKFGEEITLHDGTVVPISQVVVMAFRATPEEVTVEAWNAMSQEDRDEIIAATIEAYGPDPVEDGENPADGQTSEGEENPEPVKEEPEISSLDQARSEYEQKFNKAPDKRWGETRIRKAIADA